MPNNRSFSLEPVPRFLHYGKGAYEAMNVFWKIFQEGEVSL